MKSKLFSKLVLLIALTSCNVQTFNSEYSDRARFSGSGVGDGSPGGLRFAAAFEVLRNNCFSCHANFQDYTTESAWEAATPYNIVRNDATASPLYSALRGSGVPGGRQDMPQAPNNPLKLSELTIVRNWINNIGL
jgi:hypothetical protein